ncbi:MAG: hypothetical protein NTV52_16000 [Acidobacteria bacterium]|nr:hypothetical protein [Acidobacteriota bacterium]
MVSRRIVCLLIGATVLGAQYRPPRNSQSRNPVAEIPVTFDGTVKVYDKKFIIVETVPDQTVKLDIDKKTRLVDAKGKPLTKPPEVGSAVAVDGMKRLNGFLVALQIKVL